LQNFQQALTISQNLSARHPENAEYRRDCQIYLRKVGEAQVGTGDYLRAVTSYEQSQKFAVELVALGRGNNEAALDLALINTRLGEAWSKQAEKSAQNSAWQQARQWFQRGLSEWQAIKQRGALPADQQDQIETIQRELAKCKAALGG
jgi:hypothetical protein